jgi:hypothetical protein
MDGMGLYAQPVMFIPDTDYNSPYYPYANQGVQPQPMDEEMPVQSMEPKITLSKADKGESYQGEVDDRGERIGVGTCKWADGSYYTGDWHQNVRHGNGIFLSGGIKYEGQWVNDVKHGHGRRTLQDGEETTGIWLNDRLNGIATVKKGKISN